MGNVGSDKRKEYSDVGSAINAALRVEGEKRCGEILITPSVHEGLGDTLNVVVSTDTRLKGIDAPRSTALPASRCRFRRTSERIDPL